MTCPPQPGTRSWRARGLPAHATAVDNLSRVALPLPLTVLLGRDIDVNTLRHWLADPALRLITLVGPGGVGKTRLALELARALAEEGSTRVLFAGLAAVRNSAFVASAIAEALGVLNATALDLPKRGRLACDGTPTLLVLDNFEHNDGHSGRRRALRWTARLNPSSNSSAAPRLFHSFFTDSSRLDGFLPAPSPQMKPPVRSLVLIAVVVTSSAIAAAPRHAQVAGPNQSDHVEGVYIASIGGGPDAGHFKYPRGIAVDRTGTVYVADTGYSRIQLFDANGSFIAMWGTFGDAPGQLQWPSAVAVDAALKVYVADAASNRVQVFTRAGVFLRQWGSKGSAAGQFLQPAGIAVDAGGQVYVADTYNYRIQVFANDGTFLRSWGSKGTGPGQFHDPKALGGDGPGPEGIAIDRHGVVYVTDSWNHRVQVFTSDGRYLREWNRPGPCGQFTTPEAIACCKRGYLNAPNGIAVDQNGSVIVVNQGLSSPLRGFFVQKFTPDEEFVRMWGSDGFGPGQFESPAGVAVDDDGNFYVADRGNNRVQKFSADGRFVTQWGSIGDGYLRKPAGIALDGAGNIYVADRANKRIQKFDGTGRFLGKWGLPVGTRPRPGEATFYFPSTIAVDGAGYVYVGDMGRPTQIFTSDGRLVGEWKGDGRHEIGERFVIDRAENFLVERGRRVLRLSPEGRRLQSWRTSPVDMSVDRHGNLYVAENIPVSREHSWTGIHVFSAAGRELAKWSATRGPDGEPGVYTGIAVTDDGLVVALDVKHHRVEVFSATGTLLGQWGSYGFAAGQFDDPCDVAVDAAGRVYVSDFNNRVQVFQLRRRAPATPH